MTTKIGKLVDALTVKKAAPRAGGFRNFMKTQKNELEQMVMVEKPESAAASQAQGAGGFSATVALPKG